MLDTERADLVGKSHSGQRESWRTLPEGSFHRGPAFRVVILQISAKEEKSKTTVNLPIEARASIFSNLSNRGLLFERGFYRRGAFLF